MPKKRRNTRKFGGKTFRLYMINSTKTLAKKTVKELKNKGKLARRKKGKKNGKTVYRIYSRGK